MAEEIKKTLQDFLKEYPNKAEAVKQYLIYINHFGGEIKTN
jgi:hypothetical protein